MGEALRAFLAVFPAELPDKTMVATVVLVTRFRRPSAVWVGAATAFTLQVVLAVIAGSLLAELPQRAVSIAVAVLFATGAVLLLREGADQEEEPDLDERAGTGASWIGAAASSFGVVFLAELGDLTQLATAGLAAASGEPIAVAAGALLALWSVSALAAVLGETLARRVPVLLLRRIAAAIFAVLAVLALVSAIRG